MPIKWPHIHKHDWSKTIVLMEMSDKSAKYMERWFCPKCKKKVYKEVRY